MEGELVQKSRAATLLQWITAVCSVLTTIGVAIIVQRLSTDNSIVSSDESSSNPHGLYSMYSASSESAGSQIGETVDTLSDIWGKKTSSLDYSGSKAGLAMLDGSVIMITGAGSGIGLATAKAVVKQCGLAILVGRNVTKVKRAFNNITSTVVPKVDYCNTRRYPKTDYFIADIRDISQLRAVTDTIGQKYGRLDGAANIAGVGGPIAPIDAPEMDDWIKGYWDPIENNLYGNINSIRAEIELMKAMEQRNGVIVNAASANSFIACPGCALYVASKHAIAGLTKSVALTYAAPTIANNNLTLRVNAIAPGLIDTPFTRNQARGYEGLQNFQCYDENGDITEYGCADIAEDDPAYQRLKREAIQSGSVPIKRIIAPEEMANIIVFLLSNYSTAATGDIWLADGGNTAM